MRMAIYILMVLLLVWFSGCIVSYKTKKWALVNGIGVKSVEFIWWLIHLTCCLSFIFFEPVGKWLLTSFVLLWFVIQLKCHWYYTIFGISEKGLKGYNKNFENTIHIIPASDKRLIPDLYHIILHIILLLLSVLCIVYLFN